MVTNTVINAANIPGLGLTTVLKVLAGRLSDELFKKEK